MKLSRRLKLMANAHIFNWSFYRFIHLVLLSSVKSRKKGVFRWRNASFDYNDIEVLSGMYNEIMYKEHYKFESPEKNPLIIDCGANIGMSVLYFHKTIPGARIIAIEADPDTFAILKKNCERNLIHATLINNAVWSSDDETLRFGREGADAGSLHSNVNTVNVKTIRLKRLIAESGRIALLKLDIEGAEIEVLEDCRDQLNMVDKLFVEYHSFPEQPQQLNLLLTILSENGFRYLILPARKMYVPFINTFQQERMDLQLNVFAFRTS